MLHKIKRAASRDILQRFAAHLILPTAPNITNIVDKDQKG